MNNQSDWTRLKVVENPVEAGLVKIALEAEGIDVQLRNMELWGVAVEVLYAEGAAPSVWVPKATVPFALEVLKKHAENTHFDSLEKWKCLECKATNDGNFEICWRCQSENTNDKQQRE